MKKARNQAKKPWWPTSTTIPLYITSLLFVVFPLVYIITLSFLTRDTTWGVTNEVTLRNYIKMADPMYVKVFVDSFVVAIVTTLSTLVIGYPFSYCTAKLPKHWQQAILLLVMAPFWLNSLIRLNGWVILLKTNGAINSMLLNLNLIEEPLSLLYNMGAVFLGMTYALIPFMILSVYNSVEKMDWTLVEAARDLGASPVRAFLSVTLPLTVPGIIAGCVLVFVPSIGLFFVSDLLGGGKIMLLGNLIKNELLSARNWPFGAALSVIMMALTTASIVLYKKVTGEKSLGGLM